MTTSADVPYTEAAINILFTSNGAVAASNTMIKQANEIRNAINPTTGDVYPESEIRSRLAQLLETGRTEILKETRVNPVNLASLLGLNGQPVDPNDFIVQANKVEFAVAKEKLPQALRPHGGGHDLYPA